MTYRRSICAASIVASAIFSRPVSAQLASVSLTHTLSVTVAPRVKVRIANAPVATSAVKVSGKSAMDGLSLNISGTQPWILSIGAKSDSRLQWSLDGKTNFATLTDRESTVASGTLSPSAASTSVFVRSADGDATAKEAGVDESKAILLTIVAQ